MGMQEGVVEDLQSILPTGDADADAAIADAVAYVEASLLEQLATQAERDVLDGVDRVLCEGEHMAGRIARLGCPAHKLCVQRLGVDLQQIRIHSMSAQDPQELLHKTLLWIITKALLFFAGALLIGQRLMPGVVHVVSLTKHASFWTGFALCLALACAQLAEAL